MHRRRDFQQTDAAEDNASDWSDASLPQVSEADYKDYGSNTKDAMEVQEQVLLQAKMDIDAARGMAPRSSQLTSPLRQQTHWKWSASKANSYWNDFDEHLNRRMLAPIDEALTPRNSLGSASFDSSAAEAWVENMPGRTARHSASLPESRAAFHQELRYSPWQDAHGDELREARLEMSGFKLFTHENGLGHVPRIAEENWNGLPEDERQDYASRARRLAERPIPVWKESLGIVEKAVADTKKAPEELPASLFALDEVSERVAEFKAEFDKKTQAYQLLLNKSVESSSDDSSDKSDLRSEDATSSEQSDLFYSVTGFKWFSLAPLRISIERAIGLRDSAWLPETDPDSYCICSASRQETSEKESRVKDIFQTPVAYATRSPLWNETKHFDGYKMGEDLEFTVMQIPDDPEHPEHKVLGRAHVHCSKFLPLGFSGDLSLSDEPQSISSSKIRLAGRWRTQQGSPVTIIPKGPTIEWQNGDFTEVKWLNEGEISADIDGSTYTAKLSDEKLFWSDGDIWTPDPYITWEGKWLSKWPSGKEAWVNVMKDGVFEVLGKKYQLNLEKEPVEFLWATGEVQRVAEFDAETIVWKTTGIRGKPPRKILWVRQVEKKGRLTISISLLNPISRRKSEVASIKEPRIKFRIFFKRTLLCNLSFRCNRTVRDLKRAVYVTTCISEIEQRLFLHGAREICDPQLLSEIGLSEDVNSIDITMLRRTPEQVQWLRRVRERGASLLEAPLEMRLDKDCVLTALRQEPQFIDIVEHHHLIDKYFYHSIVGFVNYPFLRVAPESIRDDHAIVLKAVRAHGTSLQFASERLRADLDIVRAAVQQNGHALRFASDELRADREVVLLAVQQAGYALGYAALNEPLTPFLITGSEDKDLITTAMRKDDRVLRFAADSLWEDKEFAYHAQAVRTRVATMADEGGFNWNPRPEKQKLAQRTQRDIAPFMWDRIDSINLWTRNSPTSWGEV